MYKRCISACIILLLSIQMYGCKPEAENEKTETNIQYRNLSENIYCYEDKLYIDYAGETYVRLVFGWQGDEIVLLDTFELPSTWNRRTVGTDHYLISGDTSRQILWIYDLNTGNVEKYQVGEGQSISCWDVKNGRIYLNVKIQKSDAEIVNEIFIRGLADGREDAIALEEQSDVIYRMSVNNKGEIGIIYGNADSDGEYLGIIRDGHFTEIDTSGVEIWNFGQNQFYEFQLLDDKFMMCIEDIGHTLTPWNRSYEVFFDGNWKDIPCEWGEKNVLGYVDEFYYVNDYYLVYWSPWTMSGGYGASAMQNAKVLLCTPEGKCCEEMDIPESGLLHMSVYFVYSDEAVYVVSISGENYKMNVQNIPFQ